MRAKIIIAAAVLALSAAAQAPAGSVGPSSDRVRIAEVYNLPAVQLMILMFDAPLLKDTGARPLWRTFQAMTADDDERLRDGSTTGAFDMMLTGDADYAEFLESRGLIRMRAPVWRERLMLAGPSWKKAEMEGLGAAEIMRRVAARKELFFSRLNDGFVRKSESELWELAGAPKYSGGAPPGENKGYVETSRDDLDALTQAGEEGGFILTGEGSFARYAGSEHFRPALVKMADTDYFRVTYLCVMAGRGVRKPRVELAAKYLEWFMGDSAREIVSNFSIEGINPFSPPE